MADLNHFAISAALGSTLGPRVHVAHGQLGSSELASTLATLLHRRSKYINDLSLGDDVTKKYEKGVTRAYLEVRDGYSSDRVLADPSLNHKFVKACRDFGIDDTVFHLNMTLVGLRKHNKLKMKSRRTIVADQWRCSVASEIAGRVMHYRYGISVDTVLSHPKLVSEFDGLAAAITPGFTSFQYRWAALNMRKKGASAKVKAREIAELEWSGHIKFDAVARLPEDKGIYTLFEDEMCLFVAGTENIQESISSQQRIVNVPLFPPELWKPNPRRLYWQYATMPEETSDFRYGTVHSLIGQWKPIFNIPRGERRQKKAA